MNLKLGVVQSLMGSHLARISDKPSNSESPSTTGIRISDLLGDRRSIHSTIAGHTRILTCTFLSCYTGYFMHTFTSGVVSRSKWVDCCVTRLPKSNSVNQFCFSAQFMCLLSIINMISCWQWYLFPTLIAPYTTRSKLAHDIFDKSPPLRRSQKNVS